MVFERIELFFLFFMRKIFNLKKINFSYKWFLIEIIGHLNVFRVFNINFLKCDLKTIFARFLRSPINQVSMMLIFIKLIIWDFGHVNISIFIFDDDFFPYLQICVLNFLILRFNFWAINIAIFKIYVFEKGFYFLIFLKNILIHNHLIFLLGKIYVFDLNFFFKIFFWNRILFFQRLLQTFFSLKYFFLACYLP